MSIIRPQFAKAGARALFATIDGIAFKENTIGCILSSFVEKCGVQLAQRMAFVDMRKKFSTEMLNRCNTEERAILRRVLTHSEKTSRKWFARPDLTETGAEAVKIIQRLLDPSEKAKYLASKASPEMKPLQHSPKPLRLPSLMKHQVRLQAVFSWPPRRALL